MENPAIQEIIGQLKAVAEAEKVTLDDPTLGELDERLLKAYIKAIDTHGIPMLLLALETVALESKEHRMVIAQYDVLVEGLLDLDRTSDALTVAEYLLQSESTDIRTVLVLVSLMFTKDRIPVSLVMDCVEKSRRILAELEALGDEDVLSYVIQLARITYQPIDLRQAIRLFNGADAQSQERMARLLEDVFLSWEEKTEAQRLLSRVTSSKWREQFSRSFHKKKHPHS